MSRYHSTIRLLSRRSKLISILVSTWQSSLRLQFAWPYFGDCLLFICGHYTSKLILRIQPAGTTYFSLVTGARALISSKLLMIGVFATKKTKAKQSYFSKKVSIQIALQKLKISNPLLSSQLNKSSSNQAILNYPLSARTETSRDLRSVEFTRSMVAKLL